MQSFDTTGLEAATLGGGCFWCVEAVYQRVRGVRHVLPGYAGGTPETANYKAVCSGETGHVEVAQIWFDPAEISYADIIEMFWTAHDPTTLNRQGNDKGPQYRSAIFYHDEAQQQAAEASKQAEAPKLWTDPIVTEVRPLEEFYPAEDYHHNYYSTVGDRNPYCTFVITPKVKKFQAKYAARLVE